MQVQGALTADSIVGEVLSVGTVSSGVTTDQTIDMSTARFAEVYVNGNLALNITNIQAGTRKVIAVITQTATIRQIEYKLDGTSQGSRPIGDGSTTNSEQLYEINGLETRKYIAQYDTVA